MLDVIICEVLPIVDFMVCDEYTFFYYFEIKLGR